MNRQSVYIYFSAMLALVIPSPGRFVCGIVLALELILLMFIGSILRSIIKQNTLSHVAPVLHISILIVFTMIYRQLLFLLFPILAIQLGFVIYLPTVSSFLIGYLFAQENLSNGQRFKRNMIKAIIFALFSLAFFLLRDIIGFGTITYFSKNAIVEKVLFDADSVTLFTFVATIPGAIICTSLFLIFYLFIVSKFKILKNAEGLND